MWFWSAACHCRQPPFTPLSIVHIHNSNWCILFHPIWSGAKKCRLESSAWAAVHGIEIVFPCLDFMWCGGTGWQRATSAMPGGAWGCCWSFLRHYRRCCCWWGHARRRASDADSALGAPASRERKKTRRRSDLLILLSGQIFHLNNTRGGRAIYFKQSQFGRTLFRTPAVIYLGGFCPARVGRTASRRGRPTDRNQFPARPLSFNR
jgi:hypothetical protein